MRAGASKSPNLLMIATVSVYHAVYTAAHGKAAPSVALDRRAGGASAMHRGQHGDHLRRRSGQLLVALSSELRAKNENKVTKTPHKRSE